MYSVEYFKTKKNYIEKEMPDFESTSRMNQARMRRKWYLMEQKEKLLINIKSITIDSKDIEYMIYSNNIRMISFYAKYKMIENPKEKITIKANTNIKKSLIYSILTSDFLINEDELKKKTKEEINEECIYLQTYLDNLELKINDNPNRKNFYRDLIKRIKYKLEQLQNYNLDKSMNRILKK